MPFATMSVQMSQKAAVRDVAQTCWNTQHNATPNDHAQTTHKHATAPTQTLTTQQQPSRKAVQRVPSANCLRGRWEARLQAWQDQSWGPDNPHVLGLASLVQCTPRLVTQHTHTLCTTEPNPKSGQLQCDSLCRCNKGASKQHTLHPPTSPAAPIGMEGCAQQHLTTVHLPQTAHHHIDNTLHAKNP